MSERVLCVPTLRLLQCEHFEGYTSNLTRYKEVFASNTQDFQDRDVAETNELTKQLIPYVIIMQQGCVLLYQRSKKGGEARLHEKWSLGFGGHINPADCDYARPWQLHKPESYLSVAYASGLIRELSEELSFRGMPSAGMQIPLVGFINDDSNAVGRVHLGVVHAVTMPATVEILPLSDEIETMRWVTHSELGAYSDRLEPWSQICLDNIPWLGPVS